MPPSAPRRPAAAEFGLPDAVACPFCDRSETELHSAFGGQLSTATYWCRRCHTAFEWLKWDAPESGGGPGPSPDAERTPESAPENGKK